MFNEHYDSPLGPFSSGVRFGLVLVHLKLKNSLRVSAFIVTCSYRRLLQSLNYRNCSAKVHQSMNKLHRLAVKMDSSGAKANQIGAISNYQMMLIFPPMMVGYQRGLLAIS